MQPSSHVTLENAIPTCDLFSFFICFKIILKLWPTFILTFSYYFFSIFLFPIFSFFISLSLFAFFIAAHCFAHMLSMNKLPKNQLPFHVFNAGIAQQTQKYSAHFVSSMVGIAKSNIEIKYPPYMGPNKPNALSVG
jgi:hypothetical protein